MHSKRPPKGLKGGGIEILVGTGTLELPNGRMRFRLLSIYVQVSLKGVETGPSSRRTEKTRPGYNLSRGCAHLDWYPRPFAMHVGVVEVVVW